MVRPRTLLSMRNLTNTPLLDGLMAPTDKNAATIEKELSVHNDRVLHADLI